MAKHSLYLQNADSLKETQQYMISLITVINLRVLPKIIEEGINQLLIGLKRIFYY